jgi:hypothetical protein
MHRTPRKLLVLPVAGIAAASVAVAGAFGATTAPKVDHLTIRAGLSVNPGHWLKDNLRYTPFASSVKSGGTIVIKGAKGAFDEGPHTFSIVKAKQLPKTGAQVNNCKVCAQVAESLGADPNSSDPPQRTFVDGGDGFNKPGDTVYFEKAPDPLKVTAKKGSTLYYMCVVHPWMQGKVNVK